jgi:hypothetical protein
VHRRAEALADRARPTDPDRHESGASAAVNNIAPTRSSRRAFTLVCSADLISIGVRRRVLGRAVSCRLSIEMSIGVAASARRRFSGGVLIER